MTTTSRQQTLATATKTPPPPAAEVQPESDHGTFIVELPASAPEAPAAAPGPASPEPEPAPAALELIDGPQVFMGLDRELYDGITAWNGSLLKIAVRRTPAHAWAAYRDPLAPARGDSAAFRIGSMTHEAILEPDRFAAEYVVLPEDAPKRPTERQLAEGADSKPGTKIRQAWEDAQARQQWWEQFDKQHQGAEVVSAAEHAMVLQLRDAVIQHPGLQAAFHPELQHLNELTITWLDPVSGHRCKARIDALRITSQAIRVYELKSAADAGPEPFGRSVVSYDYLLSAAFYADGVDHCRDAISAALGIDERALLGLPVVVEYVVAEKEYPFLVARYELQQDQLEIGRALYEQGLQKVVAAEELGYWPGYDQGAVPLELPAWFQRRVEE